MKVLAVVLVIPAVVLTWQWWGDTRTERRLAPIVSEIAGRDVAVDCQTLWGALIDPLPRHGEVLFDGNGIPEARIFLTHETCDRLADFAGRARHDELACLSAVDWSALPTGPFARPCYERASDTVYALLTLAHEAYHTAGVMNEAVTNCLATQAIGYAAAALGADPREGRDAARAMAGWLPFQRDPYRIGDCVAGGPHDLAPETPDFPTEAVVVAPRGAGGVPGLASGAS